MKKIITISLLFSTINLFAEGNFNTEQLSPEVAKVYSTSQTANIGHMELDKQIERILNKVSLNGDDCFALDAISSEIDTHQKVLKKCLVDGHISASSAHQLTVRNYQLFKRFEHPAMMENAHGFFTYYIIKNKRQEKYELSDAQNFIQFGSNNNYKHRIAEAIYNNMRSVEDKVALALFVHQVTRNMFPSDQAAIERVILKDIEANRPNFSIKECTLLTQASVLRFVEIRDRAFKKCFEINDLTR